MGSKSAAARAEIARRLRHLKIRYREWLGFGCDVDEENHLSILAALVLRRLVHHDNKIARLALLALGELRNLHPEHRKSGMRSHRWIGVETPQLCVEDVFGRRRKWVRGGGISFEELLAVDDLKRAAAACAVAKVNPIADANRSVQRLRHRFYLGTGLLSHSTEVADETGMRGIAQVEDFRSPTSPAFLFLMGDDIGDAGVALPPVLVRAGKTGEHSAHRSRIARIRDVEDLVALVS